MSLARHVAILGRPTTKTITITTTLNTLRTDKQLNKIAIVLLGVCMRDVYQQYMLERADNFFF